MAKKLLILPLLLLIAALHSCKDKQPEVKPVNPAFSAYISGYTSGIISKEAPVRVRLNTAVAEPDDLNKEVGEKVFSFDPSIKGKTFWVDEHTLEFRPDGPMKSGQLYNADFHLKKVLSVPDSFKTFEFQFQVMEQSLEVQIDGLKPREEDQLEWQQLEGTVLTADVAAAEEVEKTLAVMQDGKALQLVWRHAEDRRSHHFTAQDVRRKDKSHQLKVNWSGKPLNVDLKGEREVRVPAIDEFELMEARVVQQPEQYVQLLFSDPLKQDQELTGLIRLEGISSPRFSISSNEIKVYTGARLGGQRKITVERGVQNILGFKLKNIAEAQLTFLELKPKVEFVGKGTIMPNSENLILPFEAVSLRAVDINIIKIYEDNVAQFLQVNNLDGQYQLRRVGDIVYRQRMDLDRSGLTDLGKPNRFGINLNKIIKPEPGAIYQVEIGFRKSYNLYTCEGESEDDMSDEEYQNMTALSDDEDDHSYWDYYDDYSEYNWRDRDNPCTKSYYRRNRFVKRNVMVSDFGLVSKKGSDGGLTFFVTDLNTTKPLSGIQLDVLNYQQQVIGNVKTDSEGKASIKVKGEPYLLIAKKDKHRGYLRLEDGNALSLSRFDVAGASPQKGLKGFIYGERGVWRPGDSLYLTFILEDENKNLPPNYPVQFELINPQNKVVAKHVNATPVNGFYAFRTKTEDDALTGNYTARVKAGGAIFTKTIKIETVKPNRLKIEFDFGKEEISLKEQIQSKLKITWLHGAVAKNAKVDISVSLQSINTEFAKYSEFEFDDPARTVSSELQEVYSGKVNAEGEGTVSPDINIEGEAPGKVKATFVTKAYEPGGDFSTDRFSVTLNPYNVYVGVKSPKGDKTRGMLLTDTNHIVNVVSLDPAGKPVPNRKVQVRLYKVEWRWWWEQNNGNTGYNSSRHENLISSGNVTTGANGEATWKMRVDYPDWGRYLLQVCDENGGHCAGKYIYIDWPGWAGRQQREQPGGAALLAFSADKEKYSVGEDVVLMIPSSAGGRALLSLENGVGVVKTYWFETEQGQTQTRFKVTEEMAPNVYATVMLLQPHAQTANDLPIRMYGTMPILVEDPASHLKPKIATAEVYRPEKTATVKVSEADGRPMTYTLAVVDEGLLSLTRYKTPNPWDHFFAREALGVKTWDIYDNVIGKYTGALEQILAIGGGDEVGRPKDGDKANRFKPVVRFYGPFHLKKGKTATHEVDIPQYVGAVRVMVVAGQDGAYGSAEKSVPVKNPLMVLATLPRVLGPDESVKLPVTVFAMEDKVKNVKVQITSNDLLVADGGTTENLTFSKPGDDVVNFNFKVAPRLGVARVKIVATSGNERAEQNIELQVRTPNPTRTLIIDTVLQAGQKWNTNYTPVGMAGTNTGVLEVSTMPPINLEDRLQYLIRYPYGCIEQTTSAAFPQLYVSNLMKLDDKWKNRIDHHIKEAISKIRKFQLSEGGIGYWPNSGTAEEWSSNYAGHFMVEAGKKGYTLPSGFLDNWKKFQKRKANSWSRSNNMHNSDLMQAYRLYTLALAGEAEIGAMNRLREAKDVTTAAKWRLAAAYALAGRKEVAEELIKGLETQVKDYRELSYTYGSDVRDEAMILETLTLLNRKTEAFLIVKRLSERLSSSNWYSTQTTAYSLLAIAQWAGNIQQQGEINFTHQIDGAQEKKFISNEPLAQIPMGIKAANSGKVKVSNTGKDLIYVRVILKGIPAPEPGGQPVEKNLRMSIAYKLPNGTKIDPTRLEQGTDFYADVTITNPGTRGHYQQLALTQIIPSGWEIVNMRLLEMESSTQLSRPEYQDIRDDRVNTFFDLRSSESKTFRIMLNSSYLGRFYLPDVQCEAMYDISIQARTPGRWVEVVKAGGSTATN